MQIGQILLQPGFQLGGGIRQHRIGIGAAQFLGSTAAPGHKHGGQAEIFAEGDIHLGIPHISDGAGLQLADKFLGEGGVRFEGEALPLAPNGIQHAVEGAFPQGIRLGLGLIGDNSGKNALRPESLQQLRDAGVDCLCVIKK